MYYFEDIIDYSERETKIISIYNYIECLIYDIKMNNKKLSKKNYCINIFYYRKCIIGYLL